MRRNILITGCSSGIGLASAKLLKQNGYQVYATVRIAEDLQKLEHAGCKAIIMDLNDSNSIKAAVETVLSQTQNNLYALINNAGYQQIGAIEDLSREAIIAQFETNVFGLLELTNHIIPVMRKQQSGRIINISSILGMVALPYRGAYNASKFALEGLTDTLRLELYGSGIHVTLIEPGPISTEINANRTVHFQSHIENIHTIHHTQYQSMLKPKKTLFSLPPEAVAKKILSALNRPQPKARYYVTVPVYILTCLKRVLPTRLLDWVLRKV